MSRQPGDRSGALLAMIATSPTAREGREPLSVLLIEDNPSDARLIRELLAARRGSPGCAWETT